MIVKKTTEERDPEWHPPGFPPSDDVRCLAPRCHTKGEPVVRSMTLLSELFPPDIQTAEEFTDPKGAFLFPEEEAYIGNAVDSRCREFTTARLCARRALTALRHPAVPLVPGVQGAPIWPASIAGSITHCAGYRAAAVAWRAMPCPWG
ncbi:4'-phosphopantetheinyl transferase [Streptomyces sp. NPDC048419]|uniref:4'-phosphopantetheinyl transferase family protein n=1 Tax=Streptomyces sp. NPDC048419 TaxID=3365547 RepID=UPI00372071E8